VHENEDGWASGDGTAISGMVAKVPSSRALDNMA